MYHLVNKEIDPNTKKATYKDGESSFKPNEATKQVTMLVQKDMQTGRRIMETPYMEFNDRSLLEEIDINQKNFNSYVPPRSDDPDDSWRAQTVRPITRNKLISIAAHVTATILYPNAFAQNNADQEDRDAALVMKDIIEWVIDNSNYSYKFLQAVVAALTDPIAILEEDFIEVTRKVKEKVKEKGVEKYVVKEVIDDLLSGFSFSLVQANEFYIANAYEPDMNRQRFVAKRKYIDFADAGLKYSKHPNWKFVTPGIRHAFDAETATFYEQTDTTMKDYLVEEVVYYNRSQDLQLTFINGILMCDPEYPIQRIDKRYPFVKLGYEFLRNGNFFYYKSAANKLASDQDLIDTMYNMVLDGTFLTLFEPKALYGTEEVDSSVMVPGTITSFNDPNSKLEGIGPRSDIRGGLEVIGYIEKSMSESSQDNIRAGMTEGGERTAYEVQILQKNAQIALGLFGKMLGFFVKDLGELIVSDILQHLTVTTTTEITSTGGRLAYKSFLLPDKNVGGKKVTKKIEFTDEYYNEDEIDEEGLMKNSFNIMSQEGGYMSNQRLYKVNPMLFRDLKFKISIAPDMLEQKSKNLEKALNLEAYDRLIQSPIVDQEAVTRDFLLDVYRPGEGDKYIRKEAPTASPEQMGEAVAGSVPNKQKGVNQNMTGQITGGNSLKQMLRE